MREFESLQNSFKKKKKKKKNWKDCPISLVHGLTAEISSRWSIRDHSIKELTIEYAPEHIVHKKPWGNLSPNVSAEYQSFHFKSQGKKKKIVSAEYLNKFIITERPKVT